MRMFFGANDAGDRCCRMLHGRPESAARCARSTEKPVMQVHAVDITGGHVENVSMRPAELAAVNGDIVTAMEHTYHGRDYERTIRCSPRASQRPGDADEDDDQQSVEPADPDWARRALAVGGAVARRG